MFPPTNREMRPVYGQSPGSGFLSELRNHEVITFELQDSTNESTAVSEWIFAFYYCGDKSFPMEREMFPDRLKRQVIHSDNLIPALVTTPATATKPGSGRRPQEKHLWSPQEHLRCYFRTSYIILLFLSSFCPQWVNDLGFRWPFLHNSNLFIMVSKNSSQVSDLFHP